MTADGNSCACSLRLVGLREAANPDLDVLDALADILHCTQYRDCPARHGCAERVRELLDRLCGGPEGDQ